ncbi:MAG: hypothetical protein O2815_09600, partial [Actinomycetota bacterium]|nr:hypothetical protein [Actinomycetota bacterium]
AYLVDMTGPDVLLEEFHPKVEELGWRGAFESAAGLSLEDFDTGFMDFMERSSGDRLQILKAE